MCLLEEDMVNIEKRREDRETAFILVFESMFRDDGTDDIIDAAEEVGEMNLSVNALNLFKGIAEKNEILDQIISKYSENRQFSRIPKINIAVLRVALYEILYIKKVPMDVSIYEAVKIAEKYAQKSDVNFINGVLGAYSRKNGDDK